MRLFSRLPACLLLMVAALLVPGCGSGSPHTAEPTIHHAKPCTGSPDAACAAELATQAGFPVLWAPVPGWKLNEGLTLHNPDPSSPSVSENFFRGGLNVGLESGNVGPTPFPERVTKKVQWSGSTVTIASGVNHSSAPSTWAHVSWSVDATWSYQNHEYKLGVFATPKYGPTGGVRHGTALLLQLLRTQVRYQTAGE